VRAGVAWEDEHDAPAFGQQELDRPRELFSYQAHPNYKKMWRQSFDLRLRYEGLGSIACRLADLAQLMGRPEVRVRWTELHEAPTGVATPKRGIKTSRSCQKMGLLTFDGRGNDALGSGPVALRPRFTDCPRGRIDIASASTASRNSCVQTTKTADEPVTVPLEAGDAPV